MAINRYKQNVKSLCETFSPGQLHRSRSAGYQAYKSGFYIFFQVVYFIPFNHFFLMVFGYDYEINLILYPDLLKPAMLACLIL